MFITQSWEGKREGPYVTLSNPIHRAILSLASIDYSSRATFLWDSLILFSTFMIFFESFFLPFCVCMLHLYASFCVGVPADITGSEVHCTGFMGNLIGSFFKITWSHFRPQGVNSVCSVEIYIFFIQQGGKRDLLLDTFLYFFYLLDQLNFRIMCIHGLETHFLSFTFQICKHIHYSSFSLIIVLDLYFSYIFDQE